VKTVSSQRLSTVRGTSTAIPTWLLKSHPRWRCSLFPPAEAQPGDRTDRIIRKLCFLMTDNDETIGTCCTVRAWLKVAPALSSHHHLRRTDRFSWLNLVERWFEG
jgi:hypothetical protein